MAVTANLPRKVEQAYLAAARTKGVSVDADVLVSHAPTTESPHRPDLVEGNGISVLRTGQPIDPSVVAETIEGMVRQ